MKPESKKAVLAEFKRQLKQVLPNYVQIKAGMPRSTVLFDKQSEDLQLYIFLNWHSYEDKFNLRVAWTYQSALDDVGSCFDPMKALSLNSVVISLDTLSDRNETWYGLRDLSAAVRANAETASLMSIVATSIQELISIGVPYLERVKALKAL
jgi:hypothetical protein